MCMCVFERASGDYHDRSDLIQRQASAVQKGKEHARNGREMAGFVDDQIHVQYTLRYVPTDTEVGFLQRWRRR